MLEIMLDVNGWQGLFDFVSGDSLEMTDKPYLNIAKKISSKYPYPGDLNVDSIKWVTNFAIDICKEYDPRLMVVSYANSNIIRVNSVLDYDKTKELSTLTVQESLRFAKAAGYEPIIVSTGNMRRINKVMPSDEIDGYLSVSSDPYMGGIFGASQKDYETVKNIEGITYELKSEFVKRYNITYAYALDRTPDIIIYADEDLALTNTGGRGTTLEMIMKKEKTCSAYSSLQGLPDDILSFRSFTDEKLENGQKIAIIIVEGIDDEFMPKGSKKVSKYRNGIYYSEGSLFYYAVLNGKEFNSLGIPYAFHNPFVKKVKRDRYPYSYIKTDKYQDPIGYNRNFKTASMGTRSGILHSSCMCDYSFECHCRGLAESGVLTFINADKLNNRL